MQVRHIAIARDRPVAALAAFESQVAIWDLQTLRRTLEFDTVLDFGGRRLAMSSDGSCCIAGAYNRDGVAAYDTNTGRVLWSRRDLKKVQYVSFNAESTAVYCGFDRRACHVLDARSGVTVRTIRGVRRVWASELNAAEFRDGTQPMFHPRPDGSPVRIGRTTFAFLDVAFGSDTMCTTESRGPVRCFDESGRELWRTPMRDGEHVLTLTYSADARAFFGVAWPFQHGGPRVLRRFDELSGRSDTVVIVGDCADTAFFRHGECLLTSDGAIIDTSTGQVTAQLPR
jgi:outer membrane protein assembly factor BamB